MVTLFCDVDIISSVGADFPVTLNRDDCDDDDDDVVTVVNADLWKLTDIVVADGGGTQCSTEQELG